MIEDRLEGPDIAGSHEASQLGVVGSGRQVGAHGSTSPPLAAGMAVVPPELEHPISQSAGPPMESSDGGIGCPDPIPEFPGGDPIRPPRPGSLSPFLLSPHPFGPSFLAEQAVHQHHRPRILAEGRAVGHRSDSTSHPHRLGEVQAAVDVDECHRGSPATFYYNARSRTACAARRSLPGGRADHRDDAGADGLGQPLPSGADRHGAVSLRARAGQRRQRPEDDEQESLDSLADPGVSAFPVPCDHESRDSGFLDELDVVPRGLIRPGL
jgi:hypothetical protein